MVTSIEQAVRIQLARIKRGQKGHSKAVRRFLKRGKKLSNIHQRKNMRNDFVDYTGYLRAKVALPFIGDFPLASEYGVKEKTA